MRFARSIAIFILADIIVSDTGYAMPIELARVMAERAVDAPERWWNRLWPRDQRVERRVALVAKGLFPAVGGYERNNLIT